MAKFAITILSLLLSLFYTLAQELSIDKDVVHGRLRNGLTYYIRANKQPEQRAEFYLIQNTGSLQEEENQRGLAHVLEHMAFNGGKYFPGNAVDEYMESIGMKRGENLNAYTGFGETVFMIMDVPTTRQAVIDSCLLILKDFSSSLTLAHPAIEKERAVVREEWRTSRNANSRLMEKQFPALLAGSKYGERLPIGSIDVINNFKPEELRAYYEKWYRPDLQAIVAVGDLDTEYVERKLTELFSDIPAPSKPHELVDEFLPESDNPIISIATDSESSGYMVALMYKSDKLPKEIYASKIGIADDCLKTISSTMLNERFDRLLYEIDPPFIFAQSYNSNYMGAATKSAWNITAIAEEGRIKSTLEALLEEVERIKQHGFTEGEFLRTKENILRHYESQLLERDNIENSAFANMYLNHFTNGSYIPSVEDEVEAINSIINILKLQDVNYYVRRIFNDNDIAVSITGPETEDSQYPSEEEVVELINSAALQKVAAYEEESLSGPLLSALPKVGEIIKEETDALLGAIILTLSNGVKVIAKQTDFKEDEVLMSATSPGGKTLFDPTDRINAKVMNEITSLGGYGDLSAIQLNHIMTGKRISLNASVGLNNESIGGYASPSDLRSLFELIYLHFTAPRMDESAYLSYTTRLKGQLKNTSRNPMTVLSDSLTAAVYNNNPAMARITEADIESLDYKRIMDMQQERFADASDFAFTFVGAVNMDSLRLFSKLYLAALPSINRIEHGDERKIIQYREGKFQNHFSHNMEVPKTSIVHFFSGNTNYTIENLISATILNQLLDIIYMDKIREEEGGSYGVMTQVQLYSFPKGRTTLQIFFDTDPEKQEGLNEIIINELNQIAEIGPKAEDLVNIKENLLKRYEESKSYNSYWLSTIDSYYFNKMDYHTTYIPTIEAITPTVIQAFTRTLLEQNNHVEIVMNGD